MKPAIHAILLLACIGSSLRPGLHAQASFSSEWPEDVERVWVGSDYWGNRIQDWRLVRGRVECLVSTPRRPIRVLHLLTVAAGPRKTGYEMQVRCGPVDPDAQQAGGSLRGFLIGSGGSGIDYRITALAHSRPAEDGGLVAGLDDQGKLVFRDFNHNEAPGGWGIGGKLQPGEFDEIEATRRGGAILTAEQSVDTVLRVSVQPGIDGYRIRLSARDVSDARELCFAELDGQIAALVEGSFGLVSHLGPGRKTPGAWFRDWKLSGPKLTQHPERSFGPILGAFYTQSHGVLKMNVQMPPISAGEGREATLEIQRDRKWVTVARAELERDSYTYLLRVEGWDGSRSWNYRVRVVLGEGRAASYQGSIARDPVDKSELVLAAFTGTKHFTGGLRWNGRSIWFPHKELCESVEARKPDLLFFSGDQIYEGDITGAQRRPAGMARLDYLDKWYRWVWAFRDLARTRPCITIPDDHDVYQGNVWGAGGRKARRQDDGGYTMPARFVRMVERTQTSHLPDPLDPRPVAQGIGVYHTSLDYGGMSFAILEDRKFKDSPTPTVPAGKFKNGWSQAEGFDAARDADVAGAQLLGERQLKFLTAWVRDWKKGTRMKVALSQTIFANVATIPVGAKSGSASASRKILAADVYPSGWKKASDGDSNGWPQTGRNKALRILRKAFSAHVAGDQHLASLIRYGVDAYDDAGVAFCVPSIGNTWPRRWWPPEPGEDWQKGQPRYTGRYFDGFGNRMRVYAVANPSLTGKEPARLHDRAPGYGIVRFDKEALTQRFECWPRWAGPRAPDSDQYPGWPRTFSVTDNYRRKPVAWFPEMHLSGLSDPLIEIVDASSGEHVYSVRMKGRILRPWTFAAGQYHVHLGEPGTKQWRDLGTLQARKKQDQRLELEF